MTTSRTGGRRLLLRCSTFLGGVALALGIGELGVRASGVTSEVRRHFDPGIYRPDAELGWLLQPDYRGLQYEYRSVAPTSTNPQGFRGPAWTEERTRAPLRVLVLGDSCTFGMGVADDEVFTAALERRLRERGQDAAVFNAGVPGYDTRQELALMKHVAPLIRPNVVLVAWLANDATGEHLDVKDRLQVKNGHLVEDPSDYDRWKKRIDHRGLYASALYRYAEGAIKLVKFRFGHRRVDRKSVLLGPDELRFSQERVLDIQKEGEAYGAKLLLLLFPQEEEVNDPQVSLAHHELMAAFAAEHGIEVLRVPQLWRAAAPKKGLYLERDPVHPNGMGYRELGAEIARARLLQPAAAGAPSSADAPPH